MCVLKHHKFVRTNLSVSGTTCPCHPGLICRMRKFVTADYVGLAICGCDGNAMLYLSGLLRIFCNIWYLGILTKARPVVSRAHASRLSKRLTSHLIPGIKCASSLPDSSRSPHAAKILSAPVSSYSTLPSSTALRISSLNTVRSPVAGSHSQPSRIHIQRRQARSSLSAGLTLIHSG